ncbi:uncharacterized protein LOC125958086 [Anopheles darlingi]|uniref:uncharacterized protein LOC125958086 n=1 Tax=Anopheles darlingi TaxID=43151 RepID=UPI00210044CA|nr:uncharacterized protein LOC125958086 [Anopheles darlingi]
MDSKISFGIGVFITSLVLTAGTAERCTTSTGRAGRCVQSDACPRFKQILDDPNVTLQQYNTLLAALNACEDKAELCCVLSDILPSVLSTSITTTTTTTIATTIVSATTRCVQEQLTGGHSITFADETSFGVFIAISGHFGHGTRRCVGSLISAEYVLTAAHCVRNAPNISVFVNANNITSSEKGQYKGDVVGMRVREIILHEQYTISKRGYDIALLRLNTPIRTNLRGSPRPICIPSGEQHDEIASVGHTLSSFGWGLNADGVISNRKQWVTLERISLDRCRASLGYALPGLNITLNELFLCTASITGHDVFSGYSGAPLMYRQNGIWFMVGIVSFGIGTTSNEFPTVSTNVQQYVGWILQQISQRLLQRRCHSDSRTMCRSAGTSMAIASILLFWCSFVCVAANRECIASNGKKGHCVAIAACPEIAAVADQDTLVPEQERLLNSVMKACGSNAADPKATVCCPVMSVTPSPTSEIPTMTEKIGAGTIRIHLPMWCGQRSPGIKIISNTTDEDYIYMWAVFLKIQEAPSRNASRCTGTLINKWYVLTAAHCVHKLRLQRGYSSIKMYLGLYDLEQLKTCLEDGPCVERSAVKIITHPQYNPHTVLNDIALIRMNQAVEETDFIQPICLPLNHTYDERLQPQVISYGWGITKIDGSLELSNVKRVVGLDAVAPNVCARELRGVIRSGSLEPTQLCTKGVGDEDVCSGDSGAPMMEWNNELCYVVGVVSYGPKCGTAAAPGISTRISEYIDWILNNLAK